MIEVFKTDISDVHQANIVQSLLKVIYSDAIISFDLEDCDNVLRIERDDGFSSEKIISVLPEGGFKADILPDEVKLNNN